MQTLSYNVFLLNLGIDDNTFIYIIAILIFAALVSLFFGSVISGANTALFSMSSKDINYFKTRQDNASNIIIQLTENPHTLYSTLRSTKVLCSVLFAASTLFLALLLLQETGMNRKVIIALVILFNIITQLLVIETIPKMYARQNKTRMAVFSASIVSIFFHLLKNFVSNRKEDRKLLTQGHNSSLDPQEFEEAVRLKLGHEPSREELDMFRGIMKFSQITVREVMQPRMNISSIREEWDLEQVRNKILRTNFSRMPVYRGTVDHITGILFSKDILTLDQERNTDWHTLIRPAFYVHETKLIEDLFQEFQSKRVHAAIVVDEFGGTSGLVTLEDILEQVVGEIRDEYEEEVLNYKKIDNSQFIFDGRTHINAMCRILGVEYDRFDLYKGQSTSIAGLLLEVSKKFPEKSEIIIIENFEFQVLEVERFQVERIKVTKK